jgi:hypothetical protein
MPWPPVPCQDLLGCTPSGQLARPAHPRRLPPNHAASTGSRTMAAIAPYGHCFVAPPPARAMATSAPYGPCSVVPPPVRAPFGPCLSAPPTQSHEDEPSHGMSEDELVRLFPRDRVAPHICGILPSGMVSPLVSQRTHICGILPSGMVSPLVSQRNTTKTRTIPSHPTLSSEPKATLE